MRQSVVDELTNILRNDTKSILLTADMGFPLFNEIRRQMPQQFLNVGIAQQNMISVATGLALEGRCVFVYSIANFPTMRCLQQIRNDVIYHSANVNIIAYGAGMTYAQAGPSHYLMQDLAILSPFAGIDILSPSDKVQAVQLLKAIHENSRPSYLRLSEGSSILSSEPVKLGKIRQVHNNGKDILYIVIGDIIDVVYKRVLKDNANVTICSMHTLTTIDKEYLLQAINIYPKIVVVCQQAVNNGFLHQIELFLLQSKYAGDYQVMGFDGVYLPYIGDKQYLRMQYGILKD